MKIYSLQEENDKLNASRGIVHPGINHDMFDVKKTSAPARQQREPVSSRQGRTMRPVPQQRRMTASPQQQTRMDPPSSQQPPQNRGRMRGMLIGWLIFIFFLIIINFLTEMF